jgi:hypothetical protein
MVLQIQLAGPRHQARLAVVVPLLPVCLLVLLTLWLLST